MGGLGGGGGIEGMVRRSDSGNRGPDANVRGEGVSRWGARRWMSWYAEAHAVDVSLPVSSFIFGFCGLSALIWREGTDDFTTHDNFTTTQRHDDYDLRFMLMFTTYD